MRKGTKAKIERQKRALARFTRFTQVDWQKHCRPGTNIKRFATEDDYADYFARKLTEHASLQVRLRNAAP